MRMIRAALAAAVLAGMLVGVPALLVFAIGSPWPAGGWISVKLMTDATVLGILAVLGWILWAQLAMCLLFEAAAEIGDVRPPRVGPRFQRHCARSLIRAVLLVGAAGGLAANVWQPLQADAVAVGAHVETGRAEGPVPESVETKKVTIAPTLVHHTVEPGDTLWGIAERTMGDGLGWRAIAELNHGRTMSDGTVFTSGSDIRPGWDLRVPFRPDQSRESSVTVEQGDSLSVIAERELGNSARWSELYEANRSTIGTNPDLIEPGQELVLPQAGKSSSGTGRTPHLDRGHNRPSTDVKDTTATDLTDPARRGLTSPDRLDRAGVTSPTSPAETEAEAGTEEVEVPVTAVTPWRALLATGSCLAVGLMGLLVANRRRQLAARRPGRLVRATPEELRPIERAIHEVGHEKEGDVQFIDLSLRALAFLLRLHRQPLPELGAAVLSSDGLTLRLIGLPAPPPGPWVQADDDAWLLPRSARLPVEAQDQPPPYPALVSTGLDEQGRLWLLDLEAHGGAGLELPAGLLAHWVTELAANPWGSSIELLVADDALSPLAALNPERVTLVDAELAVKRASSLRDDAQARFAALLDLRRDGVVEDTTGPVAIIGAIGEGGDRPSPGRDRVVVVGEGSRELLLNEGGRWSIVDWDVPIEPFGMDVSSLAAISRLLGDTEDLADSPVAATSSETPGESTKRGDNEWDESSLLPAPTRSYAARSLDVTHEDIVRLAPSIAPPGPGETLALDPELDQELVDWADPKCIRPKITVLGPVDVTANAGSREGSRNVGGTIEFIVYLAFSERGVTKERAAEDLGWSGATVQNRARDARRLMGLRPDGSDWLPDAARSEGARRRGVPTYQLHPDVLVDAELLRRLHARAVATGADGREDVASALGLVNGEPFDQLRRGGYGWLVEGDRVDLQLAAMVEDLLLIQQLLGSQGRTSA